MEEGINARRMGRWREGGVDGGMKRWMGEGMMHG
jgi:hypothetical protein